MLSKRLSYYQLAMVKILGYTKENTDEKHIPLWLEQTAAVAVLQAWAHLVALCPARDTIGLKRSLRMENNLLPAPDNRDG